MDQPPPLDPDPLPFTRPARGVSGNVAVAYADGVTALLQISPGREGIHVKGYSPTSVDPITLSSIPLESDLGDVALAFRESRPLRAFQMPDGVVRSHFDARFAAWRAVAFLFFAMLAVVGFVFFPDPTWGGLIGGVSAILAALSLGARRKQLRAMTYALVTDDGSYPFDRLLDDRPLGRRAEKSVQQVKEAYGALVSDVVYRIEYPALFDPSTPTTKAFTSALIEWDNNQAHLSGSELSTLAGRIGLAFDAAKAHAETVGMTHLPEHTRERAERAAKALRVATSKSTGAAERKTAMGRATAILEDLMLHYLPRPREVLSLVEGRRPLALPGRRSVEAEARA